MIAVGILGAFLVVAFATLVDVAALPVWTTLLRARPCPATRVGLLLARLVSSLTAGFAGALLALSRVFGERPVCDPVVTASLTCSGHSFHQGPGLATSLLLLLFVALLGLAALALFHPLPAFPLGERRPDLESMLRLHHGIQAQIETLPAEEPGCYSEIVPCPRILLLGGIEELLPLDELQAVIAHEAAHFAARDHILRIIVRAIARVLFFADSATTLDRFIREQEKRADDRVVSWDPALRLPLARALVRLAEASDEPSVTPAMAVAAATPSALVERVSRLLGEPAADQITAVPFLSLQLLLSATILFFLLGTPAGTCLVHCTLTALP